MPHIPRHRQATCHYCYDTLDTDADTTYQRVEGWARNRTQGGTNAIALRTTQPQWACHLCISKRTAGLVHDGWEQTDLFAE